MSDFKSRFIEWAASPDSSRAREAWSGAPQRAKDRVLRGFGQYLHKLVVYIRANKLSGRGIGSQTGRLKSAVQMASVANQRAAGQVLNKRSGRLLWSMGAQLNFATAAGTLFETGYGAMWEHTGHDEIVPRAGCQCSICRRSPEKWLHFKTDRGWVRTQSVKAQLPRPHVLPSIVETSELRAKMVTEPLVQMLASLFKGQRGE